MSTGSISRYLRVEKNVSSASSQSTWRLKVSKFKKDAARVKRRKVYSAQFVLVYAFTLRTSGPSVATSTPRKRPVTTAVTTYLPIGARY